VENPVVLTTKQLKAIPKQEQITQHYCIQGWSGIAKRGAVPMKQFVDMVRPLPQANWVVFYSFADGADGGRYYDAHEVRHMQDTGVRNERRATQRTPRVSTAIESPLGVQIIDRRRARSVRAR
jgi:DMSO/TMAO reductase YedYZ molybdopterin-dependent catalytic subunit